MPVSLIAALAHDNVIGNAGKLPWRLPDDLARFKRLTMGHSVVMGRRTFESMGKPLAGRRNIVLTMDARLALPGCVMAHAVADVTEAAGPDDLFVIGGARVYALFLSLADRLYLTWVEGSFPGDTFFPDVDWNQWRVVGTEAGKGLPAHSFVDYQRIRA